MTELLEYITKRILRHPEAVKVEEEVDGNTVRVTLYTHPDDIGLAIGKNGKTANALRELLKVKAINSKQRIFLDIKTAQE